MISIKNLTSGLGTDNTIQTIWIVASGMALTDLDNGRTIGLTEKDIKRDTQDQTMDQTFRVCW